MSAFTQAELEFIRSQRLGRLATVNEDGDPQIAPVGFRYNAELDTIDIGGYSLSNSKKFRNIQRNGRVAFVLDDVLPPWQPRGVEIRGRAEAISDGSKAGSGDIDAALIRIHPTRIIGWGIDTHPYKRNSRRVGSDRT